MEVSSYDPYNQRFDVVIKISNVSINVAFKISSKLCFEYYSIKGK
jgi:hypothetical protein